MRALMRRVETLAEKTGNPVAENGSDTVTSEVVSMRNRSVVCQKQTPSPQLLLASRLTVTRYASRLQLSQ
jgi:hypothetical protein